MGCVLNVFCKFVVRNLINKYQGLYKTKISPINYVSSTIQATKSALTLDGNCRDLGSEAVTTKHQAL